jgi:hypothetical protein
MFALLIRVYWVIWPESKRPTCLFRESCSHHVYRLADTQGFLSALKALLFRMRVCRPGYHLARTSIGLHLIARNGLAFAESDLSAAILREGHGIRARSSPNASLY